MKNKFYFILFLLAVLGGIFFFLRTIEVKRNTIPSQQKKAEKSLLLSKDRHTKNLLPFIRKFPEDQYQIYSVNGEGSFYIDDIQDCIKGFLRQGIAWETHISDTLKQYIKEGTVVVDAGAHIGTHTIRMSRYTGPQGRVFAFEPQPKIFRELFKNCAQNNITNVTLLPYALGKKEGKIEMGPLVNENEGGRHMSGGSGIKVPLRTLDSFHLSNVSLLKVDVENMENDFLAGAKQTILQNKPVIIIEIMGGYIYSTAPPEVKTKIEKTIKKLNKLGYEVKNIEAHDYLAIPKNPL